MKQSTVFLPGFVAALAVASSMAFAQTSVDFGKSEYMASCASCHGVSAKGDGAMRGHLTKPPSDLTAMAKGNHGVFPVHHVWEVIDGRTSTVIGSHGAREMPVWGYIYRAEDTQPADLHARNRIGALIDYLARIQAK